MKKQYITPVVYVVHLDGTSDIMQQQLHVGSPTDPDQTVDDENDIGWVKEERPKHTYNVWDDDWREQ